MFEVLANLIEAKAVWFNGFIMAGIILILVGVKNITLKEIRDYKLSHHNVHQIDEIVAWSVFYIIFGVLIAAGGIISIIPYMN
jgi:hypothetical protein